MRNRRSGRLRRVAARRRNAVSRRRLSMHDRFRPIADVDLSAPRALALRARYSTWAMLNFQIRELRSKRRLSVVLSRESGCLMIALKRFIAARSYA